MADDAIAKNSSETESNQELKTAVLVVHGMGQQQPFQPLDSFVRGLRDALRDQGNNVDLVHFMDSREAIFDHFVRMLVRNPTTESNAVRALDVYEFYWAPLTQGRATFRQILGWFRKTVLTPLKRFAFNLPLVMLKDRKLTVGWEFVKELLRVVWITVVGLAIAGLVMFLVERSAKLVTEVTKAIYAVIPAYDSWPPALYDSLTALVFLGSAVGLLAILISLPEQIRDLNRLRRIKPGLFRLVAGLVQRAVRESPAGWIDRMKAGFSGFGQALKEAHRWDAEIKARRRFLWLSSVSVLILGVLTYWITRGLYPFAPIVAEVIEELEGDRSNLVWMALLIGLGWFFKAVFVDYLGDVALYVTADETSTFYRTRSEILQESTRKLRFLLRNYPSVALAGHSLGSVIAYDTINRLRAEAKLPQPLPVAKLAPGANESAVERSLADILYRLACIEQGLKSVGKEHVAPVTGHELQRLTAFITFGSPLDKVLYFFRQRVKPYETVRAHILHELHGFRRPSDLLTSDDSVHDEINPPSKDKIIWLNYYSRMDPISAELNFYKGIHNVHRWYPLWGLAHVSYWHDPNFYREVLQAISKTDRISK